MNHCVSVWHVAALQHALSSVSSKPTVGRFDMVCAGAGGGSADAWEGESTPTPTIRTHTAQSARMNPPLTQDFSNERIAQKKLANSPHISEIGVLCWSFFLQMNSLHAVLGNTI